MIEKRNVTSYMIPYNSMRSNVKPIFEIKQYCTFYYSKTIMIQPHLYFGLIILILDFP